VLNNKLKIMKNNNLILIVAITFLVTINPTNVLSQRPDLRPPRKEKTEKGNHIDKATPENDRYRSGNKPPGNRGSSTLTDKPAPSNRSVNRPNSSVRQRGENKSNQVNARMKNEHNRLIYRIDNKDNRYAPGKNFRGNNLYWTGNHSKSYIHYSKKENDYYRKYDHRKYNHWENNWESYRWNINSWKEYYNGYHPHSYRYNKFYFYHPTYGHVLKKIIYKPVSFVHNNVSYYNYNGHFFRSIKGVGYALVDMPYGVVFNRLPSGYEKVYINGFLYFRVENLFFEMNPNGFSLIHYPERYYALNDGFFNGGYYVPDAFFFPQ
jgi:hypothetical protein